MIRYMFTKMAIRDFCFKRLCKR